MGNPVLYICSECANEYCTSAGTNRTCVNCGGFKWKQKPITNADRIRSMTDEKLAEFLDLVRGNKDYPLYYTDWLDWLKQEATNV